MPSPHPSANGRHLDLSNLRRIALGSAIGIAFYLALTYLIGFPGTLSYPDWFIQHATEDILVSEIHSSLATFVLPIIVISAVFGLILAKSIASHYFLVGCLAVGIAIFLGIVQVLPDYGLLRAIRISVAPAHWIDIPAYLALYLTLPIVSSLVGSRTKAG